MRDTFDIEDIEAARIEAKRRAHIVKGMQRAKAKGRQIGRPKEGEGIEGFLSKTASKQIIEALNAGLSVRVTARTVGVSTSTIAKVKQAMRDAQDIEDFK